MLTSLALVFLIGLAAAAFCQFLHLPRIIGMLATGILLGPFALNLLDDSILSVSSSLRQMALVIILLKAGLSLNLADLKKVGRPAVLMSFLPALCEIGACVLFAPALLHCTRTEAAVIGAVLGAVSPAVVVPRMVQLMEEHYGTEKGIPQLLLAGASLDDVFVIVLFSTFCGMAKGESASLGSLASIPVSIVTGIVGGTLVGVVLAAYFEINYTHGRLIRNSSKVILILGIAFLLLAVENWLESVLPFSGLLAVMSMACAIQIRCIPQVTQRLTAKFGKLWLAAEVILFVLVGAAVDIRYTMQAGFGVVALIFAVLAVRCAGVMLCLLGTNLNMKERLFCVISYIPKATVQAAIGSVPLSMGLPCGNLVLTVAVVSILITAPLGAIGMDTSYKKLLKH